jgi:hypothetical protein
MVGGLFMEGLRGEAFKHSKALYLAKKHLKI